jgi:predicted Ser/Thr protein kinase
VDAFVNMAVSLVSFAHRIFHPEIPPGDWLWSTTMVGALVALIPMLGTLLIAIVRKGTGNRYDTPVISVFATIGVVSALVLPWLLFLGTSAVYQAVFEGRGQEIGLTPDELSTFGDDYAFFGVQREYLAGGQTVYEVLVEPAGGVLWLVGLGKLVILPGLCLLFVMLQVRAAMRRGPAWPGRLIWVSFLVFILFTAPVSEKTAGLLWAGFLPAAVLGMIPILMIGPPSWATIRRSDQEAAQRRAEREREAHYQQYPHQHQQSQTFRPQLSQYQQQPQQQPQRQPPPYHPEPKPPPYRPDGMPGSNQLGSNQLMSGKPPGQELLSGQQNQPGQNQPGRLADTPGPLPFMAAGAAMAGAGMAGSEEPTERVKRSGESMWQRNGARFRKIRALGRGGFGTVWLAMDTQLDRTVAVKMAHVPDAETEQRMLREARALAAVRHPNCVRVYDIVEDSDGLGIVMEYIEGKPLADVVHEDGALDDVAAARLWVTIAGALNAAHAKGVLHRDVKPSNIIIDPSGSPHLIDFGIARTKGDSTLTATGMMVGTPDFLAPETAAGSGATPASDAWQLAATVSYALTGKPPRGERDTPMAALMAGAKSEPNTELPTSSVHRKLLEAALGPDPARRPTLQTVIDQTGGWMSKAGHEEEGPVTRVVSQNEIKKADRADRGTRVMGE